MILTSFQYLIFDLIHLSNIKGIPIGVTNVSELCMWMESSNKVYGRTNNPYHVGRIPGGSSGGEAAILSAAGSPMGIGSDVGGICSKSHARLQLPTTCMFFEICLRFNSHACIFQWHFWSQTIHWCCI